MFLVILFDEIKFICWKFMQNFIEYYVDEDIKLMFYGLQQYYFVFEEREKNCKLNEFLDDFQFNQVIIFVKSILCVIELDKFFCECNFFLIVVYFGVS